VTGPVPPVSGGSGGVLDVVLVAPEIATNTGAIIRLCANSGARLHLVRPLGFSMDDASLRRAGLDYHDLASVTIHDDGGACREALAGTRRFSFSSHATTRFADVAFAPDDALVFGAERRGLTVDQRAAFAPSRQLTIPMMAGNRSINLANAVAIVVYEAWRQLDYAGAGPAGTSTSETLRTAPFDP
jgi:tRNA (cytidine/uridine-2'-O-)-methyltransferase